MNLFATAIAQIQLPPDYGDREREAEYAGRKLAKSAVAAVNSRPMTQRKYAAVRNRAAIIELITSRPGICKADLIRAVGISHGGVNFHLNCLLDGGAIAKRTMNGRACYFMEANKEVTGRASEAGEGPR